MHRPILIVGLIFLLSVLTGPAAPVTTTGRVIKVLPQLLDLQGRHALSPSLYDRDAYQAYLLLHRDKVSGMRFAIQWKGKTPSATAAPLKLRVEVRGVTHGERPPAAVLEQDVKPGGWFSHWAYLLLAGDEFKKIGEVTAWRVTLWDQDRLLSEQKSFLW